MQQLLGKRAGVLLGGGGWREEYPNNPKLEVQEEVRERFGATTPYVVMQATGYLQNSLIYSYA
jgi:hypothetical protein